MGENTSEMKRQSLWNEDVVHHSAELEDRVRSAEHKKACEIRRDLERTRVDLDNTVRNLRRRLEWSELASEAFETTKDYIIDKEPDVLGMVKRNPAPLTLMAGALGWMLYRGTHDGHVEDIEEGGETMREKGSRMFRSLKQKTSDAMHSLREKSSETMDSMKEKASDSIDSISESVSEKAGSIKDRTVQKISDTSDAAKEKLHDLSDRVASGTRRTAIQARDRFSDKMQSNPLAVGAVALAVGAACGLAVPLTHQEEQLFGTPHSEDEPEGANTPSSPTTMRRDDIDEGTGIQYQAGDDLL